MAPLQHKMHNTLRRSPPSSQPHHQGLSNDIEKSAVEVDSSSFNASAQPYGWKYKSFKLGPLTIPCYASPFTQLIIVSMVCFFCPGMFNALSGMGGGGQLSANAADKANVALYSTFSVVGFFAGTITNRLGIKLALSLGGFGYCIYVAAFLCYTHTANQGFVIFAGALLGVCAGLLWTAQGAIMMSYPPEEMKGRYISWFWMIFNLGAVIGGLIPLGQNINTTTKGTVSDGTYIGFIILTALGALLAWTLVDSKDVIRADSSRVILVKNPTWKSEFIGLYTTFMIQPYILLLFPMFFSANWFYTYQFNSVNGARFDIRTRALNSVLYWGSQIVGSAVFGYCLDIKSIRRSIKARWAWGTLFVITMAIWGGGYAWQKTYTRASVHSGESPTLDWTSSNYVGVMFLYIFYGFYDAAWQTSIYWYMGALSNNSRQLANYAGFYKGIQSVGNAIVWRLDDLGLSYMGELASNWALLSASLVVALPLIMWKIQDHVSVEEDLRFSDETVEDVMPGDYVKRVDM